MKRAGRQFGRLSTSSWSLSSGAAWASATSFSTDRRSSTRQLIGRDSSWMPTGSSNGWRRRCSREAELATRVKVMPAPSEEVSYDYNNGGFRYRHQFAEPFDSPRECAHPVDR